MDELNTLTLAEIMLDVTLNPKGHLLFPEISVSKGTAIGDGPASDTLSGLIWSVFHAIFICCVSFALLQW